MANQASKRSKAPDKRPTHIAYNNTGRRLKNKIKRVLRHNISPAMLVGLSTMAQNEVGRSWLAEHGRKAK